MFSNKDLKDLILPLFVEQFLQMLVGLTDILIVSYAGEAVVSGVSLVNSFNTILIFLFDALAAGGAVIISQYIGSGQNGKAGHAASQLCMFSTVFSVGLAAVILILRQPLLTLLFGRVEPGVMAASLTYLCISGFSFPMIAVYNSGAAVCRSISRTQVTMYISAVANGVNIIGDLIGVFVLKAGAAGVAYPSLIARSISAVAVTTYCFSKTHAVRYTLKHIFAWNGDLLKKILGVAIPNGTENGIHQLVKVALSSVVALFGTAQIAANGIAQSIWSLASLMGLAMAPAFTTVIGQCMGAKDVLSANFYFRKLMKISFVLSVTWNGLIFAVTPVFLQFYAVSGEVRRLILWLVLINNVVNGLAYPFAGPLGSGLRAAGDVRFTMLVSITLTIAARLLFSVFFGVVLNWGVIGVAVGMGIDLIIRGGIFFRRFRSQKWAGFRLI